MPDAPPAPGDSSVLASSGNNRPTLCAIARARCGEGSVTVTISSTVSGTAAAVRCPSTAPAGSPPRSAATWPAISGPATIEA